MSLKICHINEDYIKYLMNFDHKVTLVKDSGKMRPYVGVVFVIGTYKYFAPLSSPKKGKDGSLTEKYKNKFSKNSSPLYERIENLKYGTLQLNNMIPVPESELIEFDIETEQDADYKTVLKDQFIYIDNHKERIVKKANRLYGFVTKSKIEAFVNMSCEFKMLETKCDEYQK